MQRTTSLGATAVSILFGYASHIKKPRISAKKEGNFKKKVIKEGNFKKIKSGDLKKSELAIRLPAHLLLFWTKKNNISM